MTSFNLMSDKLIDLLSLLGRSIYNMSEINDKLGLNSSQMKVIFLLHKNGKKTASELCKDALISKPNMTPLLDSLYETGLINKEQDKKDRRKTYIILNEKGWSLLYSFKKVSCEIFKEKIPNLTNEEIETLFNSTESIISILVNHLKENNMNKSNDNSCC